MHCKAKPHTGGRARRKQKRRPEAPLSKLGESETTTSGARRRRRRIVHAHAERVEPIVRELSEGGFHVLVLRLDGPRGVEFVLDAAAATQPSKFVFGQSTPEHPAEAKTGRAVYERAIECVANAATDRAEVVSGGRSRRS